MQFDTFGFTAAEIARKQSEKEQNERYNQSFLTNICWVIKCNEFLICLLLILIEN